jgi:hypothetical protein
MLIGEWELWLIGHQISSSGLEIEFVDDLFPRRDELARFSTMFLSRSGLYISEVETKDGSW